MQLDVKTDIQAVLAMLNNVQRECVPKAAARAINKTLTTINAQAARDIRKDIGNKLPIREIKEGLAITKAKPQYLLGSLTATGKRLPVIKIDPQASQDKTGVSYKLREGRKHIPHAFLTTMRTGHRGVFKRKSTARLPIQELYGPSIPKVFVNEAILLAMEHLARDRWVKVFSQELHFELLKLR